MRKDSYTHWTTTKENIVELRKNSYIFDAFNVNFFYLSLTTIFSRDIIAVEQTPL